MGNNPLPEILLQNAANLIGKHASVKEISPDAVLALLADTISFHLASHMPDPSDMVHRATIYAEITGRIDDRLNDFLDAITKIEKQGVRH